MSLEAVLLVVILGVVLAMFFLRNRNPSGSDSLLLQLNEALRRNAYGGRPPADPAAVAALEDYVRSEVARLAATPRNALIK